jgi:hypothetical protein
MPQTIISYIAETDGSNLRAHTIDRVIFPRWSLSESIEGQVDRIAKDLYRQLFNHEPPPED